MNKSQFINLLTDTANEPQIIRGIHNWCDRWCEKCSKTEHCTVFKTSAHLPSDNPEDFFKSLSMIFEATMDMLKEYAEKSGFDFETLKDSDIEDEYEREKYRIRNGAGISLAKEYGKMTKHWLDSLKEKDPVGMEIRLQDTMLADCLEVIQWYQYLLKVKLARALMSKNDEEKEQFEPYDSLGNAKLLLVSIERNIGAWGYIYQKFGEDQDEILDILVCLQRLGKKIDQVFPETQAFIRLGLDEMPKCVTDNKYIITMQNYVTQLLEMLQEAHINRPAPRYLELPEEMECLRDVIDLEMSLEEDEHTMESIFGVPQIYFPPENRLSDEQIRQLIRGILDLWQVFHYEADFRKGEFTEREQYTKLVNCWKETYPLFRGTNGIWHIEMYDYETNWDEDERRYFSDEEYYAKNPLLKMEDFEFDKDEEQPF